MLQVGSLDHVNITPPILELSEKEKKKLKKDFCGTVWTEMKIKHFLPVASFVLTS